MRGTDIQSCHGQILINSYSNEKKYEIKRNDFNGRTFYPTFRSTTRFFTGSDSNKIVKKYPQEQEHPREHPILLHTGTGIVL